ncbi:YvrJ family protein [Phascolarctobacterium succinatutens]|uniref:YvrJ family protein n=1 Tax=Phascolarctobacterium succinatutens TaxID=626940 RepID=UPI0026EB2B36|nr:YvrJ family protein [Phascolarctobacterium succinatutens]
MEFERLLSAAADYGFPMLVSSYLLVRMEGRIEKLSANIESLTHVLQDRFVMQFPYVQQQ